MLNIFSQEFLNVLSANSTIITIFIAFLLTLSDQFSKDGKIFILAAGIFVLVFLNKVNYSRNVFYNETHKIKKA